MISKIDSVEIHSLKVGVFVNLLMAISGWVAYSLTNSEALLLDGNFSFIATISIFTAIFIVKKKNKKSSLFPYGNYFYEAFFVLFKGLMILGLTIAAFFQNLIKIIDYYKGEEMNVLVAGPILYYSIIMTVLCFFIAFYYGYKNKSIDYKSTLLGVEGKSSKIDGFLSLIVGIALLLTTIVPVDSNFNFLLYIGDAIVVVLLSLFLLKIPIDIIKEGFIELGGGVLQNKDAKIDIERVIEEQLPKEIAKQKNYISKLGSSYLIVVYVTSGSKTIPVDIFEDYKGKIISELKDKLPNLQVEIILDV